MVKMIQDPVKSKMADGVQSWKWLNVTQHLLTPVAFEARSTTSYKSETCIGRTGDWPMSSTTLV